jgi:hypothetical protein
VWFNSMLHEEPYLGLTCLRKLEETPALLKSNL